MIQNFSIKVDSVEKKYGNQTILEDISFELEKGEILSIIGPNGAGKSTLVKIIMGLEIPTRGKVLVEGKEPKKARTIIGYVPQRFNFNRRVPMTVKEFWRISTMNRKGESFSHLDTVGLSYAKERQINELSGGELQRLMIARALGTNKRIIILDEPATGIDISGQKTIYELIHQINEEFGATVIIVSHELDVVFRHATSVLCLNKRSLCYGSPEGAITEDVIKELYGSHVGHYHHKPGH